MLELDDSQIYKQLSQDKDGIQDYQTHNQHLQAETVMMSASIIVFKVKEKNCGGRYLSSKPVVVELNLISDIVQKIRSSCFKLSCLLLHFEEKYGTIAEL